MNQYKSPYAPPPNYTDDDIYPVDYAKMQRRIVLRAARMRPESRKSLLWGFVMNVVLWVLVIMGGRWIWTLLR